MLRGGGEGDPEQEPLKLPAMFGAARGQPGWSRNRTPTVDQNPVSTGDSGRCAPESEATNRMPHPAPPPEPRQSFWVGITPGLSPGRPQGRLTLVMTRGSPCSRPPFRVKPQGAPPLRCTSTRRTPSAARASASARRSGRARGSAPSMMRGAQPLQPLRPTPMHSGKHKLAHHQGASRRPGHRQHRCRRWPLLNLLCNLEKRSAGRARRERGKRRGEGRGEGAEQARSSQTWAREGEGEGEGQARAREPALAGARRRGFRTDCAKRSEGVSLGCSEDSGWDLGRALRDQRNLPGLASVGHEIRPFPRPALEALRALGRVRRRRGGRVQQVRRRKCPYRTRRDLEATATRVGAVQHLPIGSAVGPTLPPLSRWSAQTAGDYPGEDEALASPLSCMPAPLLQLRDSRKAVPRTISTRGCSSSPDPGPRACTPQSSGPAVNARGNSLQRKDAGPDPLRVFPFLCKVPSVAPAGIAKESWWHFCLSQLRRPFFHSIPTLHIHKIVPQVRRAGRCL